MKTIVAFLLVSILSKCVARIQAEDEIDYRYTNKHGQSGYCMYCTQEDIVARQDAHDEPIETDCVDKRLPVETKLWKGRNTTFYAFCYTLDNPDGSPRYIKNCTAPPVIPGATVDCSNGVKVHDECTVTCDDSRWELTSDVTTCHPQTGNWTHVECRPARCSPLSTKIEDNETSVCNTTAELPVNTTCEVTCPPNYDHNTRELQCRHGEWEVTRVCAAVTHGETVTDNLTLHLTISVICGVILIIIIVTIACCCLYRKKCRRREKSDVNDVENQKMLLSTSTSSSGGSQPSTDVIPDDFELHDDVELRDKVDEVEVPYGSAPPSYTSVDERTIIHTVTPEKQLKLGAAAIPEIAAHTSEVCQDLAIWYQIGDNSCQKLSDNGGCITVPEFSYLTFIAKCEHRIVEFIHGVFDDHRRESNEAVCIFIRKSDRGAHGFCAKCDHHGQILSTVQITVAENPDQTDVKKPFQHEDFPASLGSTLSQSTLTAGSDGTGVGKLNAEIQSLPSNPGDITSGDFHSVDSLGAEAGAIDGAGAGAPRRRKHSCVSLAPSLNELNDEEVGECTLHLSKLQKRPHTQTLDILCEITQPTGKRSIAHSIEGATLSILDYSRDRTENIIWAKREDLRKTPAHTLIELMMQAGKKSVHLVRYFSRTNPRHDRVVKLLQRAHPACPVCKKY